MTRLSGSKVVFDALKRVTTSETDPLKRVTASETQVAISISSSPVNLMAVKIDKDALLKHRFWIMVGLSVPFALLAILLLVTSVSGQIDGVRKQLKSLFDTAKKTTDIKTPEEILIKKTDADILFDKESKAWEAAYNDQASLFRWPPRLEANYHFADGLFAKEIGVNKLPAEKSEWPADKKDELLHGTLVDADDTQFRLLDRNGKTVHTFYMTPELIKAGLVDRQKDNQAVPLNQLRNQPKDVLVAVGYQRTRYFGDRLTSKEQLEFAKTYLSQIPPILRQIDPLRIETNEDDRKPFIAGVVQVRADGSWMPDPAQSNDDEIPVKLKDKLVPPEGSRFLRFLAKDWNIQSDISDEAWIAQEDLWIQSEIYRLIRVANDSISKFTPIKQDHKAKWAMFRNPYFQMELQLKDNKNMEVKITNLLQRRQKIEAMKIRVRFADGGKAEPEVMPLVTESKYADPLEPYGDPKGKHVRVIPVRLALAGSEKRTGIFGLEQVLTWETAAVKRIDQIAIGSKEADNVSLSQKNYAIGVQPLKVEKKADATDKEKEGGGGGGGGKMLGIGGGGMQGGGPGGGGGDKAAAPLANGFLPDRYQEVTPQFRRIPVAVVLIVDQNQVDRVQTAFNNSKLRFLTTQVLLNHYPKSLKPELPADKAGDEKAPGGGSPFGGGGGLPFGGGGFPLGAGGGFRPMGGGAGPFGGGGAQPAAAAPVDEMETNMELVLYGIVTLYERYPPRAVQGEGAKTP